MIFNLALSAVLLSASSAPGATVAGDYLEVRTCDVYTGPCFANGEMGLLGKEATVAWRFDAGRVDGVDLAGMAAVAVVKASATLGDPYADPLPARTLLYVDRRASEAQRRALKSFAGQQLGRLADVIEVRGGDIAMAVGCCSRKGCAELTVNDEVKVTTRCLCQDDIHCGNESNYYPPLTAGVDVIPAVAIEHTLRCAGSDLRLTDREMRGAFLGRFRLASAEVAPLPTAPQQACLAGDARYRLVELPASAERALPEQIPSAFAELLQPQGLRLQNGEESIYDLWLVKQVPLNDKPKPGLRVELPMIPVGTLLGVIRSYGVEVDYREDDVNSGFYVMRYGIQPEDGDHMGTAVTRDFVVLTGFAEDKSPAPIADMEHLGELSIKASSTDHPLVCYLATTSGDAPAKPVISRHAERDEWVADLMLQGRRPEAQESEPLRIGLVLVGVSPHF